MRLRVGAGHTSVADSAHQETRLRPGSAPHTEPRPHLNTNTPTHTQYWVDKTVPELPAHGGETPVNPGPRPGQNSAPSILALRVYSGAAVLYTPWLGEGPKAIQDHHTRHPAPAPGLHLLPSLICPSWGGGKEEVSHRTPRPPVP